MIKIEMKHDMGEMDDKMVAEALATLTKADEIRANKELMKKIDKLAKKQTSAIKSLADIKAKAAEMDMEDDDASEEESSDDEMEDMMEDMPEDMKKKMAKKESAKFPNEKPDPLLEENGYIKRVERAQKEDEWLSAQEDKVSS